jgi:hypothetical protein
VRRPSADDRLLHQLTSGREDPDELVVAEVADAAPGIEASGEAGLALEDVADAGDQGLVEQGVAESAGGVGAEAAQHRVEVELRREDVGAEAGQLRIAGKAVGGKDPDARAAELDRVLAAASEHGPGGGSRSAPGGAPRV